MSHKYVKQMTPYNQVPGRRNKDYQNMKGEENLSKITEQENSLELSMAIAKIKQGPKEDSLEHISLNEGEGEKIQIKENMQNVMKLEPNKGFYRRK
mmetsp:Transcript_43916/g.42440  ORF Transcript_43916/g.42440 Transcript_43916/m.42440 type:complete len:96 (+) Transcript_43916:100-387(+)